jgi:hypothetical protein
MILLDQVVQILRRSQSRLLRQRLVSLHFAHCAMRRRVTVQCDGFRSEPLTLDRLREEGFRRGNLARALSRKSTVFPARSTAR